MGEKGVLVRRVQRYAIHIILGVLQSKTVGAPRGSPEREGPDYWVQALTEGAVGEDP